MVLNNNKITELEQQIQLLKNEIELRNINMMYSENIVTRGRLNYEMNRLDNLQIKLAIKQDKLNMLKESNKNVKNNKSIIKPFIILLVIDIICILIYCYIIIKAID